MRWLLAFVLVVGCGARTGLDGVTLAASDGSTEGAAADSSFDDVNDSDGTDDVNDSSSDDVNGSDGMDDASLDATLDAVTDAAPGVVVHPFESPCSPTGWCWTNPLPFGDGVRDIYRAPSGTVWVLGNVSLHRKVGSTWTTFWFDEPAVGMAGVGEKIFLVGTSIVVFDGAGFRSHPHPVAGKRLTAVAARTEADVWAVGEAGAIVHFDGAKWRAIEGKTTDWLSRVAIVSENELWVGSITHRPLHFVSGSWISDSATIPTPEVATDGVRVWASGRGGTYLLGSGGWTKISDRSGRLHARGLDDLLLGGNALDRFHGAEHDVLRAAAPRFAFSAIDARVLDDAWIGADDSNTSTELLHGPLDGLVAETKAATQATLSSVFGRAPDDLFAVGTDTLIAFDGKSWKPLAIPAGRWQNGSAAPDGGLFVGEAQDTKPPFGARVLRRVGGDFVDLAYPGFAVYDLFSPDGATVYVAGGDENWRWNGSWSKIPPADADLGTVAVDGTNGSDLWFVRANAVLHGDSTELTNKVVTGQWSVVAAVANDDVWIAPSALKLYGEYGRVGHFDGSKWTTLPVDEGLLDIDADSSGLWGVTDTNVIHGHGPKLAQDFLVLGLRSIHARKAGDQHVVGRGGIALRRMLP